MLGMSSTSIAPLSDLLELIIDYRGKTPKKLGSSWKKNGIRALSALNVKTSGLDNLDAIKYGDEELYKKWMKQDVKNGDILLTSEAPAGQVMYWDSDEKIILSQRLFALRTNAKIDPKYLKYYLQSPTGEKAIMNKISGSTVTGISAKMFKYIDVIYPSKDEQVAIGNLLYLLDKKIELNNQANDKLKDLLSSIYDYWFVQFEFPDNNKKPYKSSGGKMKFDQALKREIPESWDSKTVGSLLQLQKGLSYTSEEIADNHGVPMINLGSIDKDRNYRDEKIKYYSGKIPANKHLQPGDMLLACTDLTSEGVIIGCPIFVPGHHDKFTFSMDLSKINIISDDVNPSYIFMTLRTNWYHKYIKKFASGTNVRHLDVSGVTRYQIELPPISLQNEFQEIMEPIQKRIGDTIAENQKLTELRDWLLPMLITGQVKVGV